MNNVKYDLKNDNLIGLEDIKKSDFEDICAHCECVVTKDNDSNWNAFVIEADGLRVSRKVCKSCDIICFSKKYKLDKPVQDCKCNWCTKLFNKMIS